MRFISKKHEQTHLATPNTRTQVSMSTSFVEKMNGTVYHFMSILILEMEPFFWAIRWKGTQKQNVWLLTLKNDRIIAGRRQSARVNCEAFKKSEEGGKETTGFFFAPSFPPHSRSRNFAALSVAPKQNRKI